MKGWNKALWFLLMPVLLMGSVSVALSLGSASIPLEKVWGILLTPPWVEGESEAYTSAEQTIIWGIRFPRVMLALAVGASLSLAGVGFQAVLRNPLADPYILGVSSGAAVGVAAVILLGWQAALGGWAVPVVAFFSAALTLVGVQLLAQSREWVTVERLILSGVVLQTFLGAFLSFMLSISGDRIHQIVFWLLGSLALNDWGSNLVVAPFLLLGMMVIWGLSRSLNLLLLGEEQAAHMGVDVAVVKWLTLLAATLMTAAAVSVSGIIGFVGLVIPHIVRLLVGPDHRLLVPLCAFVGAMFLLWSDTAARLLLAPRELPIGVITALFGAPVLAFLLRKSRRGF